MKLGSLILTRDGALLWFLAASSLVAYLMTAASSPVDWTYHEWLQFAAFACAWAIGKLQVSPAPSTHEVQRGITAEGQPLEGRPI